jgi:hypothetical protein
MSDSSIELSGSLSNSHLPLDSLQNNRALAWRGPALDLFIHRNADKALLRSYYLSRNPVSLEKVSKSGYSIRENKFNAAASSHLKNNVRN